jgi:hypothetical protein
MNELIDTIKSINKIALILSVSYLFFVVAVVAKILGYGS